MKKLILLLFTAIMLVNCTKEDQEELYLDSQRLVGEWVLSMVDGQMVETNKYFACSFGEGGVNMFLQRDDINGINSAISLKDSLEYMVDGNIINISSSIDDIRLVAFIIDGERVGQTSDVISWAEYVNIQNGVDQNQGRSFTGYRCDNNYKNEIIGTWDGVAAMDGQNSGESIRVEYFSDNSYHLYTKNDAGVWVKKDDKTGEYQIMANLLLVEWCDDINSNIKGSMSETWQISIEGDSMSWRATRGETKQEGFDFVRVY